MQKPLWGSSNFTEVSGQEGKRNSINAATVISLQFLWKLVLNDLTARKVSSSVFTSFHMRECREVSLRRQTPLV